MRLAAGMPTSRTRTLAKAAETLGGEQALAEALGVNVYALAGWLRGTIQLPDAPYFAALDIVANGPFNNRSAATPAESCVLSPRRHGVAQLVERIEFDPAGEGRMHLPDRRERRAVRRRHPRGGRRFGQTGV